MKFIKQHEEATDVINLDLCTNFFTLKEGARKNPFCIRFFMVNSEDDFESWYYEKESERDFQFKYLCEYAKVQSIGK